MKLRIFIISLFLLCQTTKLFAQESVLQKKVTITAVSQRVEDVLRQLTLLTNAEFSYNSDIVAENALVTIYAVQQPVEKVLMQCFGKDYLFRSSEKHIIILKKSDRGQAAKEESEITISGKVFHGQTHEPLANTTVFDMAYMQSALSDSSGCFSVGIKPKTERIAFRFSKAGFRDTVMVINARSTQLIDVFLRPVYDSIPKLSMRMATGIQLSDEGSIGIVQTFVVQEMLINSFNTFIADKRIAQMSLLPQWGTNRRMSGSVINHFSINLLAGYSYGVSGFEFGGVANINQQNVDGLQASILLNITGGDVNGFQAAGALNQNRGNMNGLQISCLLNTVADTVRGVQISGLSNVSNSNVYGAQLSVISNIGRGSHTGAQIGGLFNYAPRPRFQLGLINIADTSDGIPVGVINIIRHGYYSASIQTDELMFGTTLFAMGTTRMHSYLGLSGRSVNGKENWGFCFGLGSHMMSRRRLSLEADFLATFISAGAGFDQSTITRSSLSLKPAVRIFKNVYLGVGPAANVFVSAKENAVVDNVINEMISNRGWYASSTATQYHLWIGAQAEMRIVF